MFGINISGAEFGGGIGGTNDSQYHWPTLSELQFYQAKGVDLVRLPFSWERMQPTSGGPLDPTELGYLKTFLANAASLGMDVIIDLHNYGRYYGQTIGSATGPTAAQFADFWLKLAKEVKDFPALAGYDLMNEPHDMPTPTAWKDAAQAAVNAIRTVDSANTIFVEGNAWSGAHSWLQYNADFIINDPAGKLVYQAHQYFDRDSSGTYRGSYDQEGAYPTVGVDRIKPFVDWLNAHGFKGMIGEFGAPSNDPRWLEVTKNAVDYMKANGLIATAWGGGTWWPTDYSMFMGAPGKTDSAYLGLLKGFFTPYSEASTSTAPTAPAPAPAPEPTATVSGTVIKGTAAADQLRGTEAADQFYAYDGNDVVFGSNGADTVDGGNGIDRIDYSGSGAAVNVDLTRADQQGGHAAGDRLIGIEHVTGSAYADRLFGDAAANTLTGGNGDDWLGGRGGGDRLDGGAGFDTADYGASAAAVDVDMLRTLQVGGDAAGDTLVGIEQLVGSVWNDTLRGGNGNDTLLGGSGNDLLEGRAGADRLDGGAGVDGVTYIGSSAAVDINLFRAVQSGGHAQGDTLTGIENVTGSRFGDRMTGSGEANVLDGGAGDDWLNGSWGSDTLIGGTGRDTFIFDSVGNANGDRVTDFNTREDRLDFRHIDANVHAAGDQAFAWLGTGAFTGVAGQLRTYSAGGTTYVAGDVNGDGVADFTVGVQGTLALSSLHMFL